MKRFFSLIAVAVLCFLLCVPAFATDAEIPPVPEFSDEMKSMIAEHDLKVLVCYAQPSGDRPRFSCLCFSSSDELYVVPSKATGASYNVYLRSSPHSAIPVGNCRYYLDTGVWDVVSYYTDEDFAFASWKQLLLDYDKPLVVAWDEVQNEFNSRDFKSFPIALLTKLTQVRKGNGIQILYTAQRWHFVDKNFRSLSFGCYQCATWFGRFTFARCYPPDVYDDMCNQVQVDKKHRLKPIRSVWFIQSDAIRESYDSFKMLETAKTKDYLSRDELAQLEQR